MTKIYIDTNIFFNVWNEEIDPKSGKALWKGSKELLDKIKEYTIENARS
jgi:hypothetical protein